ncbi:MAG: formyltransferase family protein [Thermodesulfobacteriota bacterium]
MSLRAFIITQEDCLYLPQFLHTVLRHRRANVVGITILPALMPKQTWTSTLKDHLELYGPSQFLRQSFRYAFRRGLGLVGRAVPLPSFYTVAAVAEHHGLPRIETSNVNSKEYLDQLRRLNLDLVISINASQKFKRDILALPRLGCINVHGALLPRYRGRLPSFWVLANGEKETGATVHFMNEELDDGPILLQERVPIEPDDTQDSLIRKTKAVGARLLVEAIDRLEQGSASTLPNDRSQATYFSFPTRADGLRLRQQGRRFL